MILAVEPNHPQSRAYVLKLHRDARPADGVLIGRLENVATGAHHDFENAAELLAILARDDARLPL